MPSNSEETRKAIVSAYNKMYAAKNRERIAAKARERYQQNREAILEQNRARVEEWHKENPGAVLEHKRRYREKNREKIREASRKAIRDENGEIKPEHKERHRQNVAKRIVDLETMAGRPRPELCDACGGKPDKGRSMHFDHCHTHGHFRGWLCRECNLALGNVRDDPNRLLKLVAYLKRVARNHGDQFALPGV